MTNEPTTDLQTRAKQAVEREGTRPGPVFRPDVDIVERSDEFYVTADLPGVDQDHVRIHLEEGVLSIDAELTEEPDPFRVSDVIDVDRIQATMRDGVLQLHLPKTEKHRPRQIEVRGE
jgi:HSP20 family protein